MAALANSFLPLKNTPTQILLEQCVGSSKLFISPTLQTKAKPIKGRRPLSVQASREGRGAGIFVGGFVLGGIIIGALGCIYAPQISKALTGADRKDLMRKLPKFIYDEEKALEKTRKVLSEKIAQLNSAIDDVSAQLCADDDDALNGATLYPDESEASVL